mmetsp:Transcript_50995/g.165094  ORF Transcript_50995/g.165094 Transcript_50995/m.165094 type:complete len:306 (+) Transcript_50995:1304-2221(+)
MPQLQMDRLCQCLKPALLSVAPDREGLPRLQHRVQRLHEPADALATLLRLLAEGFPEGVPPDRVHRGLPEGVPEARRQRRLQTALQEVQELPGHVRLLHLKGRDPLVREAALLGALQELPKHQQRLFGRLQALGHAKAPRRPQGLNHLDEVGVGPPLLRAARRRLPELARQQAVGLLCHASQQVVLQRQRLAAQLVRRHFLVVRLLVEAALGHILDRGQSLRPAQSTMAEHQIPKGRIGLREHGPHDAEAHHRDAQVVGAADKVLEERRECAEGLRLQSLFQHIQGKLPEQQVQDFQDLHGQRER